MKERLLIISLATPFRSDPLKVRDYVTEGVPAKTYSFKVNNPATVIIQELSGGVWTDLITLNPLAPEEGYNTYTGVTGTSNDVRLKFTGTTQYLFKDMALWNVEFVTVPEYGKWLEVPLPDDLMRFKDVNIDDDYGYGRAGSYRLEGEDRLYLSYDFEGQLVANYYAYPADVTALTDELVVANEDLNYLAFYAATYLAPNEQPTLTVLFESKYLRLESKLNKPVQPGHVPIRNTLQIGRLGGI